MASIKALYGSEKVQLIPICMGICVGLLIVLDFYIARIFASYFALHKFLEIIPFGASILIFLTIITGWVFVINIGEAIRKREIVFIILLIIGLQSIGIFPGRIDFSDLFFALFFGFWLSLFSQHKGM